MTKSLASGHRPADLAVFDYARHTPFQIVNLGNRITNASSRAYIERYGIGVIDVICSACGLLGFIVKLRAAVCFSVPLMPVTVTA